MKKQNKVQLNRRLFLRGLGGAAVAAPFLSSVEERAAKAQGVAPAEPPKRLIVMFTHNGCLTDKWFPENSHGALSASDFEGTSLAALAPHADKILLPRGIRAMNQWTPNATLGQGNDEHTQVVGSYFTCVPVTPHTSDPFLLEEATKFQAMPTAPSLDHVCAQQLSPNGIPLFLRVGGINETPQTGISYSAGETPFPGLGMISEAFGNITNLGAGAAQEDSYEVARGKSILDVVRGDLDTLERFDMSQSDKLKLEAWKELLDTTSKLLVPLTCEPQSVLALGLSDGNIAAASPMTDISAQIASGLDGADLFSNVAVLSAICHTNPVIFLKYPQTYTFAALGLTTDSHTISHRGAGWITEGECTTNANADITAIDEFYAAKFANLVYTLDSFYEGGGGTILDNTATVWFQEMSDGAAHNLNNMPIIQAGGCGGYFKTGQAVNLHDGSSDLHQGTSSKLCTMQQEDEVQYDGGTPADIGTAPINKYFCNLMNAIGVKADSTGFPAVGGAEEVSHYGMYDDTRDFASGGELPADIRDPGAFDELKA